jgi:hypothetical protein
MEDISIQCIFSLSRRRFLLLLGMSNVATIWTIEGGDRDDIIEWRISIDTQQSDPFPFT